MTADVDVNPLEIIGGRMEGRLNVEDPELLENIRYAIRQQHPQAMLEAPKMDRIALVGSGVSLRQTENELRDLVMKGAKVVTLNGAFDWCVERNIRPSMQVVMDARPSNARFLKTYVESCYYALASQCHPSAWDMVKDYKNVRIFHAKNPDDLGKEPLDEFYGEGRWFGVMGGTTVATRAIGLLRAMGYLRFDLFGIDSCWMPSYYQIKTGPASSSLKYDTFAAATATAAVAGHGEVQGILDHHAFDQPENATDKAIRLKIRSAGDGEDDGRVFVCSPWMVKQLEDFLYFIRSAGHQFLLNSHGDGLISYTITRNGAVTFSEE